MTLPHVAPAEAVALLRAALDVRGGGALLFDADGTLWRGDVSEDVFRHALAAELLREPAGACLADLCREYALDATGTPTMLARRLWHAHERGVIAERPTYEMMTYCYAGFSLRELHDLADLALASSLPSRLVSAVGPILSWARAAGLPVHVISASPTPIVSRAARHWAIEPERVHGSDAQTDARGIIAPRLARAIPYAERKAHIAREVLGAVPVLGALGDSSFDAELLALADVPLVVGDKPGVAELLIARGVAARRLIA